ncbi:helix-turn-helix domain-containing protein [Acinetobacter baumannii]|uniref:helix-turn-helix domain-containing protein n=1 Tax=Acinetobacter calcoaceticus/baumannii complex TaxID=909768 RepID=UPI00026E1780|nr:MULTISPECIES: helix-turn-helix domain-containing protein [Acinetobacter calcoaceticus/baumannii complex]ARG38649.1 DNA-binding protein [Acinetobacter baumannii]EHU1274733.1 helix-turn-helix domain-containing protein [Acinetobacter baumannii]EHU1314262.1 helix-turn-helix domain-containing protein [Acinetobacter baumannii]EHU2074805.1 helix-turn-helix domain-containing protein [Acinetobacter baumannii]EHU2630115.1 helix-turn-helix domain-containing protein [Acinetobacter baumannii]
MEMNISVKTCLFSLIASTAVPSFASSNVDYIHADKMGIQQSSGSTSINSYWLENNFRSGSIEISIDRAVQDNAVLNTYPDHIEKIKNIFNLTDEELAKVLKVSRKTLYNWKQKGSESSSAKSRKRIFDFYILAKDWKDLNYPSSKSALEISILQGSSIKDLLIAEDFDRKRVLYAGSKLNLQLNDDVLI